MIPINLLLSGPTGVSRTWIQARIQRQEIKNEWLRYTPSPIKERFSMTERERKREIILSRPTYPSYPGNSIFGI